MLESGHELRLRLEAADEVGLVGTFGSDDRDGDISLDRRLMGAVRVPTGRLTDLLPES